MKPSRNDPRFSNIHGSSIPRMSTISNSSHGFNNEMKTRPVGSLINDPSNSSLARRATLVNASTMSQNRTEKVKQVPDFKKMQEKFQQKIERGKEEKKKTVTVVKEFNFSSRPTKKETSEPSRVNKRVSPPKNKTAVSRVHCGQISKPTGTNKFSTQPTQKISKMYKEEVKSYPESDEFEEDEQSLNSILNGNESRAGDNRRNTVFGGGENYGRLSIGSSLKGASRCSAKFDNRRGSIYCGAVRIPQGKKENVEFHPPPAPSPKAGPSKLEQNINNYIASKNQTLRAETPHKFQLSTPAKKEARYFGLAIDVKNDPISLSPNQQRWQGLFTPPSRFQTGARKNDFDISSPYSNPIINHTSSNYVSLEQRELDLKIQKQKEQLDLLKNTQDRRRKQPLQNEILEHNVHYSPKLSSKPLEKNLDSNIIQELDDLERLERELQKELQLLEQESVPSVPIRKPFSLVDENRPRKSNNVKFDEMDYVLHEVKKVSLKAKKRFGSPPNEKLY